MDYSNANYSVFTKGLNPPSITKYAKAEEKLKGFVYVISKFFQPFNDYNSGNKKKDKKLNSGLNLIKIGQSTMTTAKKGGDKNHGRVGDLRTALISLKVHRFYIFPRHDFKGSGSQNTDAMTAKAAESALHYAVMKKFKPTVMRLEFRSNPHTPDKQKYTEWFHIPEKQMPHFLKFLDNQVFNEIDTDVTYGTGFTDKTMFSVRDTLELRPKLRNIKIVNPKTISKRNHKMSLRILPEDQKFSRSNEQFTRKLEQEKYRIEKNNEHNEERAKFQGTVPYWKSILMPNGQGLKFRDIHAFHEKLKDKYPNKRITNVRKIRTKIWVDYEPDIKSRRLYDKLDDSIKNMEEGRFTLNEIIMEHFPKLLKTKFIKKSMQWHVYDNKYSEAAREIIGDDD